jgi:hypothetical protein
MDTRNRLIVTFMFTLLLLSHVCKTKKLQLLFEVSDTVHICSMDERKTNLMQLLYIFIVAVGDALHVSGVFAHRQER